MIGLETPPVTTGHLPDSPHTAGHYHIARPLVSLGSQYHILTWYLDNSLREPLQCVVLTKQDEDEGDLGGGHHCILIVVRCC